MIVRKLEEVTDKHTLGSMAAAGLVEWPIRQPGDLSLHDNFTYIRPIKKMEFEFNGEKYRIQHVGGAFYPYVFRIVK